MDALIDEIVERLRPFRKPRTAPALTKAKVRAMVCADIKVLRSIILPPLSRAKIRKTTQGARQIIGAAQSLREALARAKLHAPAIFDMLDGVIQHYEFVEAQHPSTDRTDEIKRRCVKCAGLLFRKFSIHKPAYSGKYCRFAIVVGNVLELAGCDRRNLQRLCKQYCQN